MLAVANVQTGANSLVSATPTQGSIDSFNLALSQQNQVAADPSMLSTSLSVTPLSNVTNTNVVAAATNSRLPVPQAYVIAASFTVGPEIIAGVPAGTLNSLPLNTKILIAGLANADAVKEGNFLEAFAGTTLFISITLPGSPTATVATWNPRDGSVEIGQGIAKPFNFGVVNGAFFGNYRGNPLAVSPGQDLDVVSSANAGFLIGSPQLSQALSGALSSAVRAGGSALAAALVGSGLGAGLSLPAVYLTELLARIVNTGNYFVGAAYRSAISTDGTSVTLQGPGGNTTFTVDEFIKAAMTDFTYDNRNFGITEIAYAKLQWQLANGSSYFQLSAASGGWSYSSDTTGQIVVVPRRNHTDVGLALINYLNIWGQATAQPARPNATSPLTYRNLDTPPDANGLPSRQ